MAAISAKAKQYAAEIAAMEDPFEEIRQWYNSDPAIKTAADAYTQKLKPAGKRLILSVDGGGTKGYMTLHCLKKLEELTCRPAYDLFDFYAGTSTGSLIAAGLATKFSAHKMINVYRKYIPGVFVEGPIAKLAGSIFGQNSAVKYFIMLLRNGLKYMYNHAELKNICYGILQDLTLEQVYQRSLAESNKELSKRLLITAKDLTRSETLFLVNAGPGAGAFKNWRLADAIMASSVAPIFLEPYHIWVDGGVGSYANPCYETVVEATEYFTGLIHGRTPYQPKDDDSAYLHDNIIVFSFGTGVIPNSMSNEQEVQSKNFLNWILYVISEGQRDANADQVRLTQRRFSEGNNWYSATYFNKKVDFRRFQVAFEAKVLEAPLANGGLGMPALKQSEKYLKTLELAANAPEQLDLLKKIGEAWAAAIDFTQPHWPYQGTYTPPGGPPPRQPIVEYSEEALKLLGSG